MGTGLVDALDAVDGLQELGGHGADQFVCKEVRVDWVNLALDRDSALSNDSADSLDIATRVRNTLEVKPVLLEQLACIDHLVPRLNALH